MKTNLNTPNIKFGRAWRHTPESYVERQILIRQLPPQYRVDIVTLDKKGTASFLITSGRKKAILDEITQTTSEFSKKFKNITRSFYSLSKEVSLEKFKQLK